VNTCVIFLFRSGISGEANNRSEPVQVLLEVRIEQLLQGRMQRKTLGSGWSERSFCSEAKTVGIRSPFLGQKRRMSLFPRQSAHFAAETDFLKRRAAGQFSQASS
jgi:hypothetical protein